MSTYLGIDIQAAGGVAQRLNRWSVRLDDLSSEVAHGELVTEIRAHCVVTLAVAGGDLRDAATAVQGAADELAAFTLQIDAPFALARAIADVQQFSGNDNDPELDRRLAALRKLVEREGASDAPSVVHALLDTDQAGDLRLRDIDLVDRARALAVSLADMADRGVIADGDPRLDQSVALLAAALAAHASPDQISRLIAALVDPSKRHLESSVLMAAELTGFDVRTVQTAHAGGLEYGVAATVLLAASIEKLTEAVAQGSAPDATAMGPFAERHTLLVELLGTDDPVLTGVLASMLDRGQTLREALAGLDGELAARHQAVVDAIAEHFGLSTVDALVVVEGMQTETAALVERGWQRSDAEAAVFAAHELGLDLDAITLLAESEGLASLSEAVAITVAAGVMGMAAWEYRAFRGLDERFSDLDAAVDGKVDGIVSLADLEHVAGHPASFPADLVQIASQLLLAGGLRNRLDTAHRNDDVIGGEGFGGGVGGDLKISRADIDAFILKQSINSLLAQHAEAIDIADHGGAPDGDYSGDDLAVFLHTHRPELSETEIAAIETLLENGWHGENLWEAHGATIALSAGVLAGLAIASSLGPGAPLLMAMLKSGAVGAGAAGAVTIGGNVVSGEGITEDVLTNTYTGALAGLSGFGFGTFQLAGLSAGGQAVTVLGVSSDAIWLASEILDDPLFDHIDPDDQLQDSLGMISTHLGVGASAGTVVLGGHLADVASIDIEEFTAHADALTRAFTAGLGWISGGPGDAPFGPDDADAAIDQLLAELESQPDIDLAGAPGHAFDATVDRLLEDLGPTD